MIDVMGIKVNSKDNQINKTYSSKGTTYKVVLDSTKLVMIWPRA